MPTFQEAFCLRVNCCPAEFIRRVFWQTLPPHAACLALFLGGHRARYFAADRDFIAAAGYASSLNQVREEIRDYFLDSQNRGWLRQRARVRVSARRLKALARECLEPGSTSVSVSPFAHHLPR